MKTLNDALEILRAATNKAVEGIDARKEIDEAKAIIRENASDLERRMHELRRLTDKLEARKERKALEGMYTQLQTLIKDIS